MDIKIEAERIGAAFRRAATGRTPGSAYPSELRESARRYTALRRRGGVSIAKIAIELGISYETLWGWCRSDTRNRSRPRRRGRIVRVHVASPDAPALVANQSGPAVTVFGPCGIRIDGIDVATLAALMRKS